MPYRLAAVLAVSLLLPATAAAAQQEVKPRAGVLLSGQIQFPREQGMALRTDAGDSSRLDVTMGFDGRCRGGGLGEVWAAYIPARQTVRVRDGRFSARLTGVARDLGGVEGRSGHFRWKLSGRFLTPETARATVSGTAEVRLDGRVISRCKIAEAAPVRLAIRTLR
jgi:hypothetical protein